jgi:hypothetical protein
MFLVMMSPPNTARKMTRERPALVRPDPRDEEELRLAIESADRGEGLLMTADEAERALLTGEWPDSSE